MTKRRLVSLLIALAVAVAIMYLGKSCTEDIVSTNRKARNELSSFQQNTAAPNSYTSPVQQTEPAEETTEPTTIPVEAITNILGEVIGTLPPTEAPEPGEDATEPTTRKSILESAKEPKEPTTSSNKILNGNKNNNNNVQPDPEQPTAEPYSPDNFIIQIG